VIVILLSDKDIHTSILKQPTVADQTASGLSSLYLSKTSQNYANTLQSLACVEKEYVEGIDLWMKQKVTKDLDKRKVVRDW